MRWIKIIFVFVGVLFLIYSAIMYFFADESKRFTVEKEVPFAVEKIFPQFNNFQNFTRWNNYFSSSKTLQVDYYQPYEGQGSAMSFFDKKTERSGEMFIRYQNQFSTLKYQLFEGKNANPTLIDIRFRQIAPEKTKITWLVQTPKQPLLKRAVNFWTEDIFAENLDKSMVNLNNLLANKVERDQQMDHIVYDSLLVENIESVLLLGVNVSAKNQKEALYKNVILNHNKVNSFVTRDLGKTEDEIGFPVMITNPSNFKDKEISYFYGVPLSKRIGISDNNFSFRTVNPSKVYSIYYQGTFENRIKSIQLLTQKAKTEKLRNGDLMLTFLDVPQENKNVKIKISLPVFP